MIKSEMGTVSMRGTVPVIISELAHAMKGIRESLTKEYGETAAEELISRAVDASKADGDPDEIMKGLINEMIRLTYCPKQEATGTTQGKCHRL